MVVVVVGMVVVVDRGFSFLFERDGVYDRSFE